MSPTTDTPILPFADLLEASTRAITASADLYTDVLRSQADATAALLEAYAATGVQTGARGGEAVEVADEAATKAVRGTARAARRATKRTASATRKATATPRKAAAATAKAAVEAPIAGYDDLTAEEIVAKLPELSQVQLAQVVTYEQAHAKRATVLDRVKALTGPEPVPGYDELTADEAQKVLTGADATTAAGIRDYERRHKDRSSVVEAAVRNADAS